jgi:hypothetical protein
MSIYDTIEEGGHQITLVTGMTLGRSIYWCEGCGAIFIIKDWAAAAFQGPDGSSTKIDWCSRRTDKTPFRAQLTALDHADYERLKGI